MLYLWRHWACYETRCYREASRVFYTGVREYPVYVRKVSTMLHGPYEGYKAKQWCMIANAILNFMKTGSWPLDFSACLARICSGDVDTHTGFDAFAEVWLYCVGELCMKKVHCPEPISDAFTSMGYPCSPLVRISRHAQIYLSKTDILKIPLFWAGLDPDPQPHGSSL